jgi:DNA polymerase III subunit delta
MAVYHVTGEDESLVHRAVGDLVHQLVGEGDRSTMVDDFAADGAELRAVVDAAQTPPFLSESRVVVIRNLGQFPVGELGPLLDYLSDPLPTTELIVVGSGRPPKALADALKAAGGRLIATTAPSRPRDRAEWFDGQVAAAGLRLDGAARSYLAAWLGDDVGRLAGVLDTLAAAYGTERMLRRDDVAPFAGDAGGVPPWDLTDALDRGQTTTALELLHRMMAAGERHPLQVMAILHNHYVRLLALDGSGARDEASAAAAIGIKPGFPARKALQQYQKLGGDGVSRAIGLLAGADLDLRGAKEWPDELVMEVLVARLSRL